MQSTSPAPRVQQRFEALDGWRGVCACLVVLFHFHGHSPVYANSLVRDSYLFVDFFFVLSGFVIAWNYATRLDSWPGVRKFLVLRLGRVYPLHFFMLLCFIALETLKLFLGDPAVRGELFAGGNQPAAVASNLVLLQSMDLHDSLTWNGPAWSISTEFWTYVLFALVSIAVGMRNWMLVVTAVLAPVLLFHVSRTGMDTTFDYGFIRCIFGFALGVACYRIHSLTPPRVHAPSAPLMTFLEAAMIVAVVAYVSAAGTSPLSFMAPFVFAAAVLVFAVEGGWFSRLFRTRPLHWLGTLSYSIYLTHFIFVLLLPTVVKRITHQDLWTPMGLANGQFVLAYGRNDVQGTLFYVLLVAVTLAFSACTYRWIETPGRDWTRRWLSRDKQPRVATQEVTQP